MSTKQTGKITIAVSLLSGILLGCGARQVITKAHAGDDTSHVPRTSAAVTVGAGEVVQCQVVGACVQYVIQRNLGRGFGAWEVFAVTGQAVGTLPGTGITQGSGDPAIEVDAVLPAVGPAAGRGFSVVVGEPATPPAQ